MEILTRSKCQECDGAGVVTHHAWLEFYQVDEDYKKKHGSYMDYKDCEDWFRERGYSKMPPEEPTCSECEGSGKIERWMDIQQVLEAANIVG